MKANDVVYGGSHTQEYTVRNLVTGQVASSNSTVHFVPALTNQLQNVSAPGGDYKNPTTHAYTRYAYGAITGRTISMTSNPYQSFETIKTGDLSTGSAWHPGSNASVYNACLSDLNSQVRSQLDLSVSIAQAGQVVRMVRGVQDLVHYVRKFPQHALKSMYAEHTRLTNVKRTGSRWLEFQYGWKPLAQDIYLVADQILNGLDNLCVLKARAQDGRMDVIRNENSTTGLVETQAIRYSHRVEMQLKLALNDSAVNTLSNFSSLNPVSLAWELVPFSFVIDWVYDIGGYMRNAETALLNSMRFKNGYVTRTSRTYNSIRWTGSKSHGSNHYYSADAAGWTAVAVKSRQRLYSYPFPLPPRFKAVLGSGRLLNAAALLTQQLGDGTPGRQYRRS